MTSPDLSIIIPIYNEESNLVALWDELKGDVLGLVPSAEVIAIDDGSQDGSGAWLDETSRSDPRLKVIHQPNQGHGPALHQGLRIAQGAWIFLIDSDRQIPLAEFSHLWGLTKGEQDAILGVRTDRQDPWFRLVLSRLIAQVLNRCFKVQIADANAPFKLFRRRIWSEAGAFIPADTLAPSLFLAFYIAERKGLRWCEVPVRHRARAAGNSTLHLWKLIRFCSRAFGQLLAFRRRLETIP